MDSHINVTTYNADVTVILIAAGARVKANHTDYRLYNGYAKVLKQLLAAGTKLSDKELVEIFYDAVVYQRIDQVEILINAGINLNMIFENGRTPFSTAVRHKRREIADLLLSAGADPYLKSKNPKDLFWVACKDGDTNTVRSMLPTLSFDIDYTFRDGSALFYAVKNGHADIVKLLIDHDAYFEEDYLQITPLMTASLKGYADVVKVLLEAGANIDTEDDDGDTALAQAANVEIAEILLEAGAHIDQTSLINAFNNNKTELAYFLFSKGANIDEDECDALLLEAFESKNMEFARFLLNNGANPDDEEAFTYALEYGDDEYVRLLVNAGANPYRMNSDGVTALEIALSVSEDNAGLMRKVARYEFEFG